MATVLAVLYLIGYFFYVVVGMAIISEAEDCFLGFIMLVMSGVFWFVVIPLLFWEER